jgi:hypothetical protein
MVIHFSISGFDFLAIPRKRGRGHFALEIHKVMKEIYLWSGVLVTGFESSGFSISTIPGIRSRALDIESSEVAKRDIPSELGYGHEGRRSHGMRIGQGIIVD